MKKEILAQVFSCEFFEISKNFFFTEHIWETSSVFLLFWNILHRNFPRKKSWSCFSSGFHNFEIGRKKISPILHSTMHWKMIWKMIFFFLKLVFLMHKEWRNFISYLLRKKFFEFLYSRYFVDFVFMFCWKQSETY